ncbi:MAG: ABC transporter substrate-binding protein [Ideonella sp.]|nr:ABC transporter substrate-binding protein [Ideonella sp.]
MKRRTLVGAGSLLLAGTAARAQATRKIARIGILVTARGSEFAGPQPESPLAKALLRGLADLGYTHGQHYVTEPRGAEGKLERYPVLTAELVALGVDVIVASGPALFALQAAKTTIPVVMSAAIDPVADGLVQSLSRPGTNFTGLSHQWAGTAGKLLEMPQGGRPGPAPVAVLWDRGSRSVWKPRKRRGTAGWRLLSLEIKDASEIEAALKSAAEARAGALFVLTGLIAFPNRQRIAELALRNRLPAMFDMRPYVDAGGLISYGADLVDLWRQSARFIDKILKGAKPADLPVEQPNRYELVINLKSAKALGITIPPAVLVRADDVIR